MPSGSLLMVLLTCVELHNIACYQPNIGHVLNLYNFRVLPDVAFKRS